MHFKKRCDQLLLRLTHRQRTDPHDLSLLHRLQGRRQPLLVAAQTHADQEHPLPLAPLALKILRKTPLTHAHDLGQAVQPFEGDSRRNRIFLPSPPGDDQRIHIRLFPRRPLNHKLTTGGQFETTPHHGYEPKVQGRCAEWGELSMSAPGGGWALDTGELQETVSAFGDWRNEGALAVPVQRDWSPSRPGMSRAPSGPPSVARFVPNVPGLRR